MLEAGLWGLIGGLALVIGAVAGLWIPMSQRAIGLIMAFGAGALISALAFELTAEAHDRGGADAVALGLLGGALVFYVGDRVIDRRGGANRKRSSGEQAEGSPMAIVLGAVLDGIPESVAIGVSLLEGGGAGVAIVAAVFVSNMPESIAAATGLRKAGRSRAWILGLWTIVMLVSAVAAAIGYASLGDASPNVVAVIQAFAAGAIITMLADTMMPEAFEHGGNVVGLMTAFGFLLAFLLSTV